ncbi:hypothetical protein MXB_3834 [Myxobolus squamalis]|nr:hypothetical protein MXB_3834 [Myxobolus squamalis]
MNHIVKGVVATTLFAYFFLSAAFIYLTYLIPIFPMVILLPRSFRIMADFVMEVWIGIFVQNIVEQKHIFIQQIQN